MMPADTEVRHGYTLADLHQLAKVSVNVAYGQSMDYRDRYDAAWHAIAELLCSADQPPTRLELKNAGVRAVDRIVENDQRHRGFNRRDPEAGLPRFERYWALGRVTPSPEDAIVDRIALAQIWPRLSATHQRILLAYATYSDHALAAAAIDRNIRTYGSHLRHARAAYRALWHEHEIPSAMWGQSRVRPGSRSATRVVAYRTVQRARRAAKAAGEAA